MADKLAIGVIGAGGIARRRPIPGLLEARTSRLAAVMDVAGAEEIAREFSAPAAYSREADLLADPSVQAVYVATPVHLHRAQVEACAAAGKPLLCEKPLAAATADAAAMAGACAKAGVLLREAYMMPYHGAHQAMRRLIAEGRIGRVVSVRGQLSCWYPPIEGAWRQRRATGGGGALIDMASHLYQLIETLVAPIEWLTAVTGNLVHAYESEDASTTLMRLANGAQATVDAFFCVPDAASRNRLEIYGSHGALVSEGTIGQDGGGTLWGCFEESAAGYDAGQQVRQGGYVEIPFERVNPYTAECEAFADAVRAGEKTAADAVGVMPWIERAYAAAAANAQG